MGRGREPRDRRTRTRLGCDRCRLRRRKCDQGKPHCQRCVEARAECNYAVEPFIHVHGPTAKAVPYSFASDGPCRETFGLPKSLQENKTTGEVSQSSLQVYDTTASLKQHYVDVIAPWMDIGDAHQTFGRLIPKLAETYPAISNAVLQLSAESLAVDASKLEMPTSDSVLWQLSTIKQTEGVAYLIPMLSWILRKTQNFVESIPGTWDSFFGNGETSLLGGNFDTTEYRVGWLASVSLMSRLEIAWALMFERAPMQPSRSLRDALQVYRPPESGDDGSFETIDTHLRIIATLTDVAELCFESPAKRLSKSCSKATVPPKVPLLDWNSVATELRSWHTSRPLSFQEQDQHPSQPHARLPRVTFKENVAVAANMMYHVSMLYMHTLAPLSISSGAADEGLQPGHGNATALWHAQRICGIAVAHKSQTWDPAMIAAFFAGALRIASSSQQAEVLECFAGLERIGWKTSGLTRRLQDAWAGETVNDLGT